MCKEPEKHVHQQKYLVLLVIVIGLVIYTMLSKDYFNTLTYQAQSYVKRDENKEAMDETENQKITLDGHQFEFDSSGQISSNPASLNEPEPTAISSLATSNPLFDRQEQKVTSNSWAEDEDDLNAANTNPLLKTVSLNTDPSEKEGEIQVQQDPILQSAIGNFTSISNKGDVTEQSNGGHEARDYETRLNENSIPEAFLMPNEFLLHGTPKQSVAESHLILGSKINVQNAKGLLGSLLNDEPNSHLLPFSICPFLGIREIKINSWSNSSDDLDEVTCRPKKPSEAACKKAYLAYSLELSPLKCDKQGVANALCYFKEDGNIQCDVSPCKDNYVYLSSVDPDYGIVTNENTAFFVSSNEKLERLIQDYIKSNAGNGFNFCFLKCWSRKRRTASPFLEQLVIFPPLIAKGPSLEPPLININILTLDSVSRAHFYRSLPNTVEVLRRIVHDPSLDATVLDFELFQSTADYTFHNIRTFMSGKTDFDYKEHQDQHYEIEYLFRIMKSKGYHTLLQEDSCWYDEWGSLYTDNLFQGKRPQTLEDFHSRWSAFKEKVRNYYIDDFGLSHFSCEALQRYNITNQFNRPKRICFGGKVFAEYFLDYAEKVFRQKQTSKRPIFAYTHLNTGHEVSGTRIKQMDRRLSQFFLNMARHENTLTLVFSDHGPKTTSYAFHTIDGRAEIYDSLLFAILPEKTALFLGHQRTKALITNQKRLLTALELHTSLISIGDKNKENSESTLLEGIFAEIPSNRSCADISLRATAVCKCDGWETFFETNHPSLIWLAELALGTLNNRIQNEYMQSTMDSGTVGGFGRCQRLVGKKFEKIRRRSIGENYLVTMDLIVQPENEIFEVQIEYPKQPSEFNNNVTVTHLSRISIYRRFEKCKDDTVNLTICVCKSRKYSFYENRLWIKMNTRKSLLRVMMRAKNFGAEVKFTDLHANCLVMVTRSHLSRTSVFEIANACTDRSYKIKVSGTSRGKAILSRQLPLSLTVEPLTVHFLFSVYHLERPYGYKATTSYRAYFMD